MAENNDKMIIEIPLSVYFEQLELMEDQYGLEEDLYPWIYMLLQMAEYKKQMEGNDYVTVSIRDVHNYKERKKFDDKYSFKKSLLSLMSTQQGGAPDMVVCSSQLDKNNEYKPLGCVEVKILNDNDLAKLSAKKTEKPEKELTCECTIIYKFKVENTEFDEKKLEAIIENDLNEQKLIKVNCTPKTYREIFRHFWVEVKSDDLTNIQNYVSNIDNLNSKIIKNYSIKLNCAEESQIIKHLIRFKKVIYTNGLIFFYLELNGEKVNLIQLADLRSEFKKYKDDPNLINENECEFKNLIIALTAIQWDALSNIEAIENALKEKNEKK